MKKLLVPVVGAWFLFLMLCGLIISRADFTADMSAFLPRHPTPRQQILIDQISDGFASRIIIVGIEGAAPNVLAQISTSIANNLRSGTDFSIVHNGQSMSSGNDKTLLFNNRYILSPAMNEPSHMSVEGLRNAVQETLLEISSSTGLFSKSLLSSDPTGESLEVIKHVIPASQPSMTDGVWMSSNQRRALLLLQTGAQGTDLDAQQAAHAAIIRSFSQAQEKIGFEASKAILKFSGPSTFAVQARDSIKSEAAKLSSIGIIMVLSLLWLIYRSFTTLFLGIIPVLTGALAGVAAVAIGFPSVHGMTLGFGVTLIGESIDYAIYLFVQYTPTALADSTSKTHKSQASTFWSTIRLGVLTSIFGFSTLLLSGFTGLAQLGLFSISGILVAAIVTKYVLPSLLPVGFQVRQSTKIGFTLAHSVSKLQNFKLLTLAVTVTAITLLAVNFSTLWSTELGGLSPVSAAAQKLDEELRSDLSTLDTSMLVVIKAPDSESALEASEQVAVALNKLLAVGTLQGFQAPSTYLPSQAMQTLRRSNIPQEQELRQRMAIALKGLPISIDKLQDFFNDTARAREKPLLHRSDFLETSLAFGIDSLLSESTKSSKEWTALIALQSSTNKPNNSNLEIQTINDALKDIKTPQHTTLYVVALKTEATNLYKAYLKEAILLSMAGFVCIIGLLFAVLRSWRRVARVTLPLLSSVSIVAATIFLMHGSLNLLHLVGLLLIIAIGSNYALFFDQRALNMQTDRTDNEDQNVLCSMFYANLSTVLGFGLLAFSTVPVMNSIGFTVGLGTFLALVFSAIYSAKPKKISTVRNPTYNQ